jgi:hypothetical protein
MAPPPPRVVAAHDGDRTASSVDQPVTDRAEDPSAPAVSGVAATTSPTRSSNSCSNEMTGSLAIRACYRFEARAPSIAATVSARERRLKLPLGSPVAGEQRSSTTGALKVVLSRT